MTFDEYFKFLEEYWSIFEPPEWKPPILDLVLL